MLHTVHEGHFAGIGGARVFHRWVAPHEARAAVVLLHGYSEHSGRYVHVMQALAERGYAVFAQDHRGHGRTAEVHGLIERMSDVLGDIGILHRRAQGAVPGRPVFLLAHSMGGLIGTLYLQSYQDEFAGAVINGAAMQPPEFIPKPILKLAKVLSVVAPRLPFQPFYNPQRVSRDPEVWRRIEEDPWVYKGRIRARTGAEGLRAIARANRDLHHLRLPLLVTHGAIDRTVPVSASQRLYEGASSTDKTLHLFEGLLHEVHQEPEKHEVIGVWADWLDARRDAART